jgi:glycosyltransferase involved in cell wall biosynthesis
MGERFNGSVITSRDTMGERFNGSVIHRALTASGHGSSMLVYSKGGSDPSVSKAGNRITRFADVHLLNPLQQRMSVQSLLTISGSPWCSSRSYRGVDIVHLHLVHGAPFFSLLSIPALGRRHRLVWTLHDPWLQTGHCIYPKECTRWRSGCGECPDLERPIPVRRDRTALMWRIKRRILKRSRVTLVVASGYMREIAAASPMTGGLQCRLIPFGVDASVFRPASREAARSVFGIGDDSRVISFRFRGLNDPHKGARLLADALAQIRYEGPVELLVLEGGGGLEQLQDRFTIHNLGWLSRSRDLADVYNASDVFLMPSTAEAFGLMAVEAMACGTPVVVCKGTALPETVLAPRGGLSAAQDPAAIARTVESLLGSAERRREIGDAAARLAGEHYSEQAYVDRHLELYHSLMEERS